MGILKVGFPGGPTILKGIPFLSFRSPGVQYKMKNITIQITRANTNSPAITMAAISPGRGDGYISYHMGTSTHHPIH